MFIFPRSSLAAFVLVVLSQAAHAQAAPVPYANSNWFLGLGNSAPDASDDAARNGMPSGWFMNSTRGSFNTSGFNRLGAFGGYNALSSEGVQFVDHNTAYVSEHPLVVALSADEYPF